MEKYNNKQLNKNATYNAIKSASNIIYPLITFPYISRILMTENVGKINFGNSVVSYFSLIASLGVATYAIRECSKVRSDKEQLGRIASEIMSINIISTLIAYLSLFIIVVVAKPLENYRLLICVQSASILFTTLGTEWLNTVMEDFKYITIRTVAIQVVSLIMMFLFVNHPSDYMKYAVISVLASSGANVINVFYRRRYCKVRFTFNMEMHKHLPPIILLFSLIMSQTIYTNSDMTILGIVQGDYQVGLYSTSVKIYNLVNMMVSSVAYVVMPQLALGFSKGDYKEINRLLKYSLNFILVFGIPCVCGLEIISWHLIYIIAGEAYVGADLSLKILGISLLFSFIGGWIGNMTMLPAGRERVCLRASIISATINIALNFLLIPIWGLNAAALTTLFSELVGIFVLLPNIDKKIRIDNICKMLVGPLLGGVGILVVGYLVSEVVKIPWMVFAITLFSGVICYYLVLRITHNEFLEDFLSSIKVKMF